MENCPDFDYSDSGDIVDETEKVLMTVMME